jgi:hypothetical protein
MEFLKKSLPLILLMALGFVRNVIGYTYTITNMSDTITFGFTGSPDKTVMMSGGSRKTFSNADCIATAAYSIPIKAVDRELFNELKSISDNYINKKNKSLDRMLFWYTTQQDFNAKIKGIASIKSTKSNICGNKEIIFGKYDNKLYAIVSK